MAAAHKPEAGGEDNEHGRVVFISASFLAKQWREVPPAVLDPSVFFFGSDRRWVFPSSPAEVAVSKRQPTNYLAFDEGFKGLILAKERAGLVFWLKPACDYSLVSRFLQTLTDPVTGEPYKPLQLDPKWWRATPPQWKGRFTSRAEAVVLNFLQGEHDYTSTMELLHQSNPTLRPRLRWE
eukprot:TRINITY_DN27593_c0_g1_i1.p3 TRINITY_DN27593_c0_g1~~TRINITY_DN27593_c0_g1_i1.p3  ORF type:complete len:180 (+),score=35.55 TRINITY_DN27593_c0_g1_i1:46-585(+)